MSDTSGSRVYSEPEYAKVEHRRKYPFYHPNIERKIPEETRELLEKYSNVPKALQSQHVHEFRDRAFDIRAYPCTGLGSWLVPQLRQQPLYDDIVSRTKQGAIVVDIGTFIGHDLRRLSFDGAPTENLHGVDIVDHFDTSFDFFQDREKFKGHFIEGDFLSTDNVELEALRGRVDIVIVSQLLHQWDLTNQTKAAIRLVDFCKLGSVVVGNQIGNLVAQEINMKSLPAALWRHDPQSFADMWREVGEKTGTSWRTEAQFKTFAEMGWDPNDSASWMEDGVRVLEFAVQRLA